MQGLRIGIDSDRIRILNRSKTVASRNTNRSLNTMPLIPYVIEKSGREERAMDIYSRLLKDRIVLLGSQVNDEVANTIVAQMLFLQSDDPKADIHLYINSPGGSVTRRPGDLRHDAVRHLRRGHLLHRPGGVDGRRAADRRRRGQAARAAQRPDHDPPAAGRHGRHGRGHHDPRQGIQADQAEARTKSCSSTPAIRSTRSRRTPTATTSCRPKKPPNTSLVDRVIEHMTIVPQSRKSED